MKSVKDLPGQPTGLERAVAALTGSKGEQDGEVGEAASFSGTHCRMSVELARDLPVKY